MCFFNIGYIGDGVKTSVTLVIRDRYANESLCNM